MPGDQEYACVVKDSRGGVAGGRLIRGRRAADFEQACRDRRLKLFVLPPRSPKLNGRVERAQRTHTEEFYEVTPCSWLIPQLNQELGTWERTYNTVRPHQALGYLTPLQFLHQWQSPSP